MSAVAILVPVLRRPHRVTALLDSIEAATPQPHSVHFICDPGDHAELQAIHDDGRPATVSIVDGNYATKINQAARDAVEPLLFLAADDLHFHPGWLEAAQAKLTGPVGVVGTQDLCNGRVRAGEHATHSLIARWYAELGTIDEPGKILHEGYPHEYVDDELVATAKHRGAWAFAHDSIVEHLHPDAGKAPLDDIYAARGPRMHAGRRIFRTREHLWT